MTWKKKRPAGGARVNGICEALEVDAAFFQMADQFHEIFDSAPQAIQLPHHQGIPGSYLFEGLF